MKKVLDYIVSIALVLASIAVVYLAVNMYQMNQARRPPEGIKVGDKVTLPGVLLGDKTLVAAVAQGCHFCEESYPFYLKLQTRDDFRLLVPKEQKLDYFYSQGFNKSVVYLTDFKSIKVSGTPTLFLLDSSGKVQKVWQGKLSPEKEAEVLASLSN